MIATRLARPLALAAVAAASLLAGTAAQARTDVFLQIGVPLGYAQPQAVYVQPHPVYVQPYPAYGYTTTYAPVRHHRRHKHHRQGPWGDADRDGVPNVYDREPYNPYRR